jgi:gliding motility-associated lipoprotein GldB
MKKWVSLFSLLVLLSSCDKKNKIEKEVEEIPVTIKVERFDKIFYETPVENFQNIKQKYPYFFPAATPDSIWVNKINNPLYRELYTEVQKKYSNFEKVNSNLESLFKHIKYYFPNAKTPKVITLISEMDYQNKAIYTDSLVLISLDLYLGKNHKFYEFPEYIKQNFEQNQIMPDIVSSFSVRVIPFGNNRNLLSQMIYEGKKLYLKDLLMPEISDAEKIGYTPEQITWCQENESYMWRHFMQEQLLYSTDSKLTSRFINTAPFSKFYLEIDNESPGRVGTWVGWQIVRSYMNNNDVNLQQLLQMDPIEIFQNSKYKPKK